MTPEQLAELFIEDKHDILPNIIWHMNVFGMLKQRRTDYEDKL